GASLSSCLRARRIIGLAATGTGFSVGGRSGGRAGPGGYVTTAPRRLCRAALARGRQRSPESLLWLGLCFWFWLLPRRALLDRRCSLRRHRRLLVARAYCCCRTAGGVCALHRLVCTPDQPGDHPSAIARNRSDFSIRDCLDRGRMGPGPCVYS